MPAGWNVASSLAGRCRGIWNAALRAAGLEVNKEYGKWTRELAITALRRWSAARRTRPHSATVEKLFGS